MPDITGSPAFDLAIGLGFVYFVLSLVVSAVQELIAGVFKWRAETLEDGLRSMLRGDPRRNLEDLAEKLLHHPLIRSMYRDVDQDKEPDRKRHESGLKGTWHKVKERLPVAKRRGPSYVSPRAFSLTIVDILTPGEVRSELEAKAKRRRRKGIATRDETAGWSEDLVVLEARINGRPGEEGADGDLPPLPAELRELPEETRKVIDMLLHEAEGQIEDFRQGLERWFDDAMARVSGWYKRKSQIAVYVIAALLTVALNANTLAITKTFMSEPAVLSRTVAQVPAFVPQAGTADAPEGSNLPDLSSDEIFEQVANLSEIGIPLGWSFNDEVDADGNATAAALDPLNVDPSTLNVGEVLYIIGGWLLTIVAIGFGAPFWFDTLSRLARLRSTGKPETPLPTSGRGLANERIR